MHSGGEENVVDIIWGTNATKVGTQFNDLGSLSSQNTYRYQNYLPSGAGFTLWLDAEDNTTITHSSNAVSQWNDKSGNGNHATQATSSKMPTYTVSNSLLNNKSSVSSAPRMVTSGWTCRVPLFRRSLWLLITKMVQTQHLTITTP